MSFHHSKSKLRELEKPPHLFLNIDAVDCTSTEKCPRQCYEHRREQGQPRHRKARRSAHAELICIDRFGQFAGTLPAPTPDPPHPDSSPGAPFSSSDRRSTTPRSSQSSTSTAVPRQSARSVSIVRVSTVICVRCAVYRGSLRGSEDLGFM